MPAARALGQLVALFLLSIHAASAAGLISQTLCNATALDQRLDALAAKPECAEAWPAFARRMNSMEYNVNSLDAQGQALAEFCKSPCGPLFDAAAADWRGWCAANRATAFGRVDPTGFTGSLWLYTGMYGCTAQQASGRLCARAVMDLNRGLDKDVCAFTTSCCAGEAARLAIFTDKDIAAVERDCPGSRAAMDGTCKA